jgi:hypothetical protein
LFCAFPSNAPGTVRQSKLAREIHGQPHQAPASSPRRSSDHAHSGPAKTFPGRFTVDHQWRIGTPQGKFGTFNLLAVDSEATHLEFSFHAPRVLAGVDVYNGGPLASSLTVHGQGLPDVSVQLQPGELQRVRTGWKEPRTEVTFEIKNGEGLRFDNLAFQNE